MVLQQSPAKAAVYGHLAGPPSSKVTVTVTPAGAAAYTVAATVTAAVTGGNTGGNATWKVFLKPEEAGGNYTIKASYVSGCSGSATITDVSFGDVWYCSGQSNMALPVRVRCCLLCIHMPAIDRSLSDRRYCIRSRGTSPRDLSIAGMCTSASTDSRAT